MSIKKLGRQIALLRPKNLAKEVHVYGYHFSWKAHMAWIFGAITGCVLLELLFHLQAGYFSAIVIAIACTVPVLVLDMYKRMYEQRRFADVTAYMEQILYSFLKTGKVVAALKETRELFDDGAMRDCIDAAVLHMELGTPETKQGVLAEGLKIIEKMHPCGKIVLVHNLLLASESYGGSAEESVFLLLEDIERYKRRGYRLQADKKKSHTDNVISIVVANFLCAIALYVLEAMRQKFGVVGETDIFSIQVIQISSTVFIILLLCILVKSTRSLTDDWIEEKEAYSVKYMESSYKLVLDYEERKQGIKLPLMLHRRVAYYLAKKDVTESIYMSLPQWLMGLILLLQHNNVQVALLKSADNAPYVLQRELTLLKERMDNEPEKLQTYMKFCAGFDVPEIESCMKMLHAFSENGTGDLHVQMNQLLGRVWQMQEKADEVKDAQIAFQMKLIFAYPVLAATAKLLTDLTVGMAVMMQVLGSIGGV